MFILVFKNMHHVIYIYIYIYCKQHQIGQKKKKKKTGHLVLIDELNHQLDKTQDHFEGIS